MWWPHSLILPPGALGLRKYRLLLGAFLSPELRTGLLPPVNQPVSVEFLCAPELCSPHPRIYLTQLQFPWIGHFNSIRKQPWFLPLS